MWDKPVNPQAFSKWTQMHALEDPELFRVKGLGSRASF